MKNKTMENLVADKAAPAVIAGAGNRSTMF